MKRGDTFLWDPDGADNAHLFIVMTEPRSSDGKFVVFNLTRSLGGPRALTLQVGDHPFITKYNSDVNFGDGLITDVSHVEDQISRRRAKAHSSMDLALVNRIARAALVHPAVSGDVVRLIRSDLGVRSPSIIRSASSGDCH